MSTATRTPALEGDSGPVQVQYITDERGNRLKVILSHDDFEGMLDRLEEINDIRTILAARGERTGRRAADVFAEIERERGWNTK